MSLKSAEQWHHTQKFIDAHVESLRPTTTTGQFKCSCISCRNVRAIQADALRHAAELCAELYQEDVWDSHTRTARDSCVAAIEAAAAKLTNP